MHSLNNIFSSVGEYAQWAETWRSAGKEAPIDEHPLFQYPAEINKNLNKGIQSLSMRQVTVCEEMSRHDPLYVLNIPLVLSSNSHEALLKWNHLTSKIRDESFGRDVETSRRTVSNRICAIMGVNRSTSISREDDDRFKEVSQTLPLEKTTLGFNCQIITTLWKSNFLLRGVEVNHEIAQMAFLVLEYLDLPLAAKVRRTLESNRTLFRKHIPYVHIREWIKNTMLKTLESMAPERMESQPIYMTTLDSDTVNLRGNQEGLFSAYDNLVLSMQSPEHRVQSAPRLMSTGYFAPLDAKSSTQIAILIDMLIREYINRSVSLSPYFPEPNTCILVNEAPLRALLTFISTAAGLDTENRRLIANIRPILEQDLRRIRFVSRRCLLTTIPDRMEASQSLSRLTIQSLSAKQLLKSLKGISQTHADVSILSNNLWIALKPAKSSQEMFAFKSIFTKVFACFDPIKLADSLPRLTRNYTSQCFDFTMKVYPTLIPHLWNAFCNRHDPLIKEAAQREWIAEAQKIRSMKDETYVGAFNGYFENLCQGFQDAKKALDSSVNALQVLEVAKNAGQAIFDTLAAQLRS